LADYVNTFTDNAPEGHIPFYRLAAVLPRMEIADARHFKCTEVHQ
jgi:hypothetical protein